MIDISSGSYSLRKTSVILKINSVCNMKCFLQTTELDTKARELNGCSASFISFLERTLTKDPIKRVTSTEALKLDWLADSKGSQLAKGTTTKFSNFAAYSKSK